VLLSLSAQGQDPISLDRPAPQNIEYFGTAVAASGERVVVGALADRSLLGQLPTGAVYVYTRDAEGWALEATLYPYDFPELSPTVSFGRSVAIDGDVIVVGAPFEFMHLNMGGDASTQGAVYVFRYDGAEWVPEAKLAQPPFTSQQRLFGYAVTLQGDRLVATELGRVISGGNPGFTCLNPPNEPGQARVFQYTASGEWEQEAVLTPIDGQTGNSFGNAVTMDGDRVAVGAYRWYDPEVCDNTDSDGDGLIDGTQQGRAYVYRLTDGEWVGEAAIQPEAIGDGDQFAFSLALSGSTLLAGAPFTDEVGARFGAAFSYTREGTEWSLSQVFAGEDTNAGDRFGYAVGVEGDYAVIGAPRHDNQSLNLGAMYAFQRQQGVWEQGLQITLDADTGDFDFAGPLSFGAAVAVSGTDFVIGAPDDPRINGGTSGDRVGSAHVYSIQTLFAPVSADPGASPLALRLRVPYPNPTTSTATVEFEMGAPGHASLTLYDVLGRRVAVLLDEERGAGTHRVAVDAAPLAAGVYLLRLEAGGEVQSRRLTRR